MGTPSSNCQLPSLYHSGNSLFAFKVGSYRLMGIEQDIILKLDEIRAILKRIEDRQIKTTAMVSEVKEHEAPVVGSFASSDLGEEKK